MRPLKLLPLVLLAPLVTLAAPIGLSLHSSQQGLTFNGNPIAGDRSDPAAALSLAPDNSFFSMGFMPMGWLIVELDEPISAGELTVWETTFRNGNYCLETAEVYVADAQMSQWLHVGTADNERGANSNYHESTLNFDAGLGICVKYIKLVHSTTDDEALNGCPTGDGFDVEALYLEGDATGCNGPDVVQAVETVAGFRLEPNAPNPFNPTTTLSYSLERTGHTRLSIHDLAGREVALLSEGLQDAGAHEVTFDAGNLPSGMYLFRLEHEGQAESRKMLLSK